MTFDPTAAYRTTERLAPLFLGGMGGKGRVSSQLSQAHQRDLARAEHWSWRSNILAIGVGEKSTDRQPVTGELCLKFFVREKLAKTRLRSAERIPAKLKLSSIRNALMTDIEEFPGMLATHSNEIFRPVRPGASIGHFRGSSGSVGLIVRRIGTAQPLLLSCSHVLALAGRAQAGDPIEQPADRDQVIGPNRVGMLTPWFTRITPGNFINDVDAALATLDPGQAASASILDIGNPSGVSNLLPNALSTLSTIHLQRSGAATGKQSGFITAVQALAPIRISVLGDRVATFRQLVIYRTRCSPGDSGAAVIDARNNTVVGIHVAGNGDIGAFIPIQPVLNSLGAELF